MHALRTAIIEHTTAVNVHHDWLIEDPTLPDPKSPHARLWTARVAPPPHEWAKLKRFDLTVIPPHRRIYLDYQGTVSDNRGYVRRLAQGTCQATLWSQQRILMTMRCEASQLNIQLTRQAGHRWLAIINAEPLAV